MSTTSTSERWRLPDGVDELLPSTVRGVESLRQAFLALGESWGFAPVSPPLIESLDGLLTGTGEALQRDTFQMVDQLDGRMLGVRADMTPQVARMDAYALASEAANRLLYTGSVLRARADGIGASRNPQQIGAELFGHAGPDSDIEIIRLMIEAVKLTGLAEREWVLDLGHIGVYAGLVERAGLGAESQADLFDALMRGSAPDAQQLVERLTVDSDTPDNKPIYAALQALTELRGSAQDVLSRAAGLCAGIHARVDEALARVASVCEAIERTHPEIRVHIDLCELRGYRYHTGLLFALHDAAGRQLARGGRYDAVGEAFGSRRPATGFSADLKQLASLMPERQSSCESLVGIAAADLERPGAWEAVASLRHSGRAVATLLPGVAEPQALSARLVPREGSWNVEPLSAH